MLLGGEGSVDAATTIRSEGVGSGDGGQVIVVVAGGVMDFADTISARGGAAGGDGGFAEVSGHQRLADLSATHGATGTLLLDPVDFTIGASEAATIVGNLATSHVVVATNGGTVGNGDVFVNASAVSASANSFTILAHRHVRFNACVQSGGGTMAGMGGAVNVVASWDGMTGPPTAGLFDFTAITATPTSYGNTVNGEAGSVFIGSSTSTEGVAVGSRFGHTNVAALQLTLRGSDSTSSAFAQLGFRADSAQANFDIDRAIGVTLKDDLTATAGSRNNAYVQVVYGGMDFDGTAPEEPDGNYTGAISVSTLGNLSFTGSAGNAAYAQLGLGGVFADGDHSGAITITQANDLAITGGGGSGAYAQLGHGDESGNVGGTRTGDLFASVLGSIRLTGAADRPARLGHATTTAGGITANLTLPLDQANLLTDGGGRLMINAFSAIDTGGAPNQFRIFDNRRDGPSPQTIADGAVINGAVFNGGGTPGTLAAGQWTPNTEFVNWPQEQWGNFTVAAPGPYTGPFTFFFATPFDYGDARANYSVTLV